MAAPGRGGGRPPPFPPDEPIPLRRGPLPSPPPASRAPGGARRWPRPAGAEEQPRLQPGGGPAGKGRGHATRRASQQHVWRAGSPNP